MRRLSLLNNLQVEPATGPLLSLLAIAIVFPGCAGGGASSGTLPPPPPTVTVSVAPPSASVLLGRSLQLNVTVAGTNDVAVIWSVNGVPGGNSALGIVAPSGLYTAPADLPSPASLQITATSAAYATKFATAQITILNHVVVSVLPESIILAPGGQQSFTANVLGSTNQNVVWQIQGTRCSAGACGSITGTGVYTAPGTPPSPNTLQVVAISADDSSQRGTANVTVSSGANLQSLHPASVYAGAALGFVLRISGGGFLFTNPGPGSTLLIAGNSRTTSCLSTTECTAAVFPSDVSAPGNITVQIQNPDGSRSNTRSIAVVAPNFGNATIALSGAAPAATGKDIVVVEPTTAGVSVPGASVDLDIAALGTFSVGSNTCSLSGNPIVLVRPYSGAANFDICLFSQSGLDTSMSYTVTGSGDVSVVAKQPASFGIIHLTLQVQSTAQTGARTLFIQNLNLDKTAASGVLEVQ